MPEPSWSYSFYHHDDSDSPGSAELGRRPEAMAPGNHFGRDRLWPGRRMVVADPGGLIRLEPAIAGPAELGRFSFPAVLVPGRNRFLLAAHCPGRALYLGRGERKPPAAGRRKPDDRSFQPCAPAGPDPLRAGCGLRRHPAKFDHDPHRRGDHVERRRARLCRRLPEVAASGRQAFVIFLFAVAASEVAVGLALIVYLHRRTGSVDANRYNLLKG